MPGMPFCNLHTCLAWERDMSLFHENLENQIGKEKLKASLHQIPNKSNVKNNLSAQTKDGKIIKAMEQVVHLEWTIKVLVPSHGTFSGYYAGSSTKANPFKAESHPPEPVQTNDSTYSWDEFQ